jgi:hypothetical protein
LAVACSSEIDDVTFEEVNEEVTIGENPEETAKENPPTETHNGLIFEQRSFTIPEHSAAGSSIGFLTATNTDENSITYTLESETDIDIDENTGELKVGANLKLDFESEENLEFTVSAFDGKTITEKTFTLNIQDVDETALLTEEQKELVTYFQYLTLWKGPYVNEVDSNRKWTSPLKLHLSGAISDEYRATVESVLFQYNTLFTDGDFSITLIENADEADGNLFFGPKEEVEDIWPDMYEMIKDGNYGGYAMTPSQNAVLLSTRIWISNPIESLFKHELGHALGFGHSNRCDAGNSIMCSMVGADSEISPIEADIIRYLYHRDFPAGLSEAEIKKVLANLIVNEESL